MRRPLSVKVNEAWDCIARCLGAAVVSVAVGTFAFFIFYGLGLPSSPAALVLLGIIGGGMVFSPRQQAIASVSLSAFWAIVALAVWLWFDESDFGAKLLAQTLQGCGCAIGVSLLWSFSRRAPGDRSEATADDDTAGQ